MRQSRRGRGRGSRAAFEKGRGAEGRENFEELSWPDGKERRILPVFSSMASWTSQPVVNSSIIISGRRGFRGNFLLRS